MLDVKLFSFIFVDVQFEKQMGRGEVYEYKRRHTQKSQVPAYMADLSESFKIQGHIKTYSFSLSDRMYSPQIVEFDRVAPRDAKMFYISESHNLDDFEKQAKKTHSKFNVFNMQINSNTPIKLSKKLRPDSAVTQPLSELPVTPFDSHS